MIATIHNRNSHTTVIAFSGMAPHNHMFEWTKSFADLNVNLIGVQDPHNHWYQDHFYEDAHILYLDLQTLNTKFLLCIGGSAGGFAALLFGDWLGADRIIAFCPQSACGEAKRNLGDNRWPEICLTTPSMNIAGGYPSADIHYAVDDALDVLHARRLVVAKSHAWKEGGHDLPIRLKQAGTLRTIIQDALRC